MIKLSISASLFDLLIKGIPESFLFVLAVYVFTRIRFNFKKYVILSLIFTFIIYLTRWLPINLGTHTMLSLLILILLFIVANKVDLQMIIKSIVSVIIIAIIIVISEELNVLLLIAFWGQSKAGKLLSGSSIMVSVYEIPSTVIFALVILASYFVLAKIDKNKKVKNGEIGAKTSE
jgi:signal transduction histidine kinase